VLAKDTTWEMSKKEPGLILGLAPSPGLLAHWIPLR